jgi:hypothetical protein
MRGLVIHREAYYEKILCTRWNKMRSSTYQSPVRVGHIHLKRWTAGTVGDTDRHAPVINALQFLLLLELMVYCVYNCVYCKETDKL